MKVKRLFTILFTILWTDFLDYLYFSVQYCLLGGPEKKKEKKKEIPPRTPDELDSEHQGKKIIYNTF